MTLIVGTAHWNGVCITTDTRVTYPLNKTHRDDVQKLHHVHGGVGVGTAGNVLVSQLFLKSLRNRLEMHGTVGAKLFPGQSSIPTFKIIIEDALSDLSGDSDIQLIPPEDSVIQGIVGINDSGMKLRLNRDESYKYMMAAANSSSLNTAYVGHIAAVAACERGEIPYAEFAEFNHNFLMTYEYHPDSGVAVVETVPFGTIVALGSGSNFEYSTYSPKILGQVLFDTPVDDIDSATLHLAQMYYHAEQLVPEDSQYGFRTFGGAILPGVVTTNMTDNMSMTRIVLGDLTDRKTMKIISGTHEKNGELLVNSGDGIDKPLVLFSELVGSALLKM
jgi:hypothetical protein